jgi:hypothetical protein
MAGAVAETGEVVGIDEGCFHRRFSSAAVKGSRAKT